MKKDAFQRGRGGTHVLNKSSVWSAGSYLFSVILFTQGWINPSLQRNLLISEIKATSHALTVCGSSWKWPAFLMALFGPIYRLSTNNKQEKKKRKKKLKAENIPPVYSNFKWIDLEASRAFQLQTITVCFRRGHMNCTLPLFLFPGRRTVT